MLRAGRGTARTGRFTHCGSAAPSFTRRHRLRSADGCGGSVPDPIVKGGQNPWWGGRDTARSEQRSPSVERAPWSAARRGVGRTRTAHGLFLCGCEGSQEGDRLAYAAVDGGEAVGGGRRRAGRRSPACSGCWGVGVSPWRGGSVCRRSAGGPGQAGPARRRPGDATGSLSGAGELQESRRGAAGCGWTGAFPRPAAGAAGPTTRQVGNRSLRLGLLATNSRMWGRRYNHCPTSRV